MATYILDIRPRRQATFPNAILKELGLEVGDSFEIEVQGKKAILTPKKQIALNALNEIREAFKESRIPMSAFMKEVDKQRLTVAKSFSGS
jgi:bifunctional DNA-binding transcriptional regulator/antitoxin component of YhaV-PrlF toxin-antitoxin module